MIDASDRFPTRLGVTLRQLEIFLAVARAGHVTRAAAALHLSQSAASAALAAVEAQLGGDAPERALCVRQGRRLRLTARGQRLADEVARLLERASALPAWLDGTPGEPVGELRLAASQTVGRDLLAPALARFLARHPGVSARCRVTSTAGAVAALLAGDADVAFVEGERATGGPGLVARAWRRDELGIVTATRDGVPAALRPADIARLPWVLREAGSGTRERFDAALRDADLPPVVPRLVLDDTEAVRQAVRAGYGWSCLPAPGPAAGLASVAAPFLDLRRRLWRVARQDAAPGVLLAAFEAFLDPPDGLVDGSRPAATDL